MFNHFSKTLVAATLIAGGVTAAQAEGTYIGGALGTPNYSSRINGVGGDDGGVAAKLFGGYRVTPNLAVEGGFVDLGHTEDASGRARVRGLYADAVASYMFTPGWSVLGSAGVAQARFSSPGGSDWSPALKVGAGVQYDVTPQAAVTLQADRYHFINAYGAKPNVGMVTAGVKFGF